ncbi:SDR family oxidoreductase [Verrucomicrobiaceae bacterium N1E253]|uniref:SDR family oxidoreductase n=1 Tax=Oceaniferula marina TaxID=2748318 RepID=A0A851GJY6_9BACT|nr:SDR family oxidoreductase [Oceaniferula marina]NWK57469.1 SDR family oxidoreductase [Oceaniferula marina]
MIDRKRKNDTRVIWLTGCTSGLGRALLDVFIQSGHRVCGCGRNEDVIEELKHAYPDQTWLAVVDVADDGQVARFCEKAYQRFGPPDLLVNNAALVNRPAPLWEITAEEFDALTAVNINGTANLIRHSVPLMQEAGKGVIVNYSSGWGRSTSPEVAPYCASKWAVEGLSQALAQELPAGLAVVALNPGIINTPMLQKCFGEEAGHHRSPEEWAAAAAPFLLGLDASDNGQALTAP